MPMFQRGDEVLEANQFFHPATGPFDARTREDGSAYVITDGKKVDVESGDWIVIESPVSCRAVKPEQFDRDYKALAIS